MKTLTFNNRKLSFYRSGGSYYFLLEEDGDFIEGDIIIGTNDHGGEKYSYVSHVEVSSDQEFSDEEQEEFETYLDNYLTEIFNAEKI